MVKPKKWHEYIIPNGREDIDCFSKFEKALINNGFTIHPIIENTVVRGGYDYFYEILKRDKENAKIRIGHNPEYIKDVVEKHLAGIEKIIEQTFKTD